jgi:hypothetical protein
MNIGVMSEVPALKIGYLFNNTYCTDSIHSV